MDKILIVGSGIVGCTLAHELAEKGYIVNVWEKRNHVGGNLFDFTDDYGIRVHLYGPHIFHTKIDRVWNYINKFCAFEKYNLICGSVIDGKCVPTFFDFTSVDIFFPDEASIIKEHIKAVFGERKSASVIEMLESGDEYISKFAQFLYDKDYAPYTAKQWGIKPEEVDRDIFKRVPVLFSYGSKYFDDPYQGLPKNGYTELINNLLDHNNIFVKLNYNALNHISIVDETILIDGEKADGTVIYTGPLDELFGCVFGKLPYRSLSFEWVHENIESFQDMPVVAYPQAEGYTRITEYKKLPYQQAEGTTYAIEYPLPYIPGNDNEPYYPVLTDESRETYQRYKNLADKVQGLIYCGRLADFKYINMDQAVERALIVAENF